MNPSVPVNISTFSTIPSPLELETLLTPLTTPLLLRGFPLGPSTSTWTPDHLIKSVSPSKIVSAHKSCTPQLDFISKNFSYVSLPFSQLVQNCSAPPQVKGQEDQGQGEPPFYWYLRSLGDQGQRPQQQVSDLSLHFPSLAQELEIPQLFPKSSFFSSVFRISSPTLQLWTHYDTLHNILIQIVGSKKVLLFPPGDALNLYLVGDKSEVLDLEEPDLVKFPKLKKVTKYEALLEPGDILFIPAFWFHNITAIDFSVSVNVFWKNLEGEVYDKKDIYGNRELVPAQLAFKTFENATSQLKNSSLPPEYQDFYLRRMIISIKKKLEQINLDKQTVEGTTTTTTTTAATTTKEEEEEEGKRN